MTPRFRLAASTTALVFACAAGFGLFHLPARAQFSGGASAPVKPGDVVVYAATVGAPSVATADGRGNVVMAYSGGLIAVVTPDASKPISTYRINADGTVDAKPPFKPRTTTFPQTPVQGGFGNGRFDGGGKGF